MKWLKMVFCLQIQELVGKAVFGAILLRLTMESCHLAYTLTVPDDSRISLTADFQSSVSTQHCNWTLTCASLVQMTQRLSCMPSGRSIVYAYSPYIR